MVLHVFAQSGDEMKSLFKKQVREGSGNISAIPKQLATQPFDHARHRSAIIDIAWSETTSQQLASIIDGQVQLKPKEPAHARLATFGIRRKDAVRCDPFGITDLHRSRVNKADACASSIATLHIGEQGNQHRWNQGDKALITDQMRKFAGQMNLDMFSVIGFKGAIVRPMKMDENGHYLT